MHIIDLLFCSWKTFDVKFGRYLDPFSISIDIRRSQRSRYGSYFAIDSVRLHNCEPGTYQEITMLIFPGMCPMSLDKAKLSNIGNFSWSFFYWFVSSFLVSILDYYLFLSQYMTTLFMVVFLSQFKLDFLEPHSNPPSFQAWIFLKIWNTQRKKT